MFTINDNTHFAIMRRINRRVTEFYLLFITETLAVNIIISFRYLNPFSEMCIHEARDVQ